MRMIRRMEKASIYGLMEELIVEIGKMANNMDMASILY